MAQGRNGAKDGEAGNGGAIIVRFSLMSAPKWTSAAPAPPILTVNPAFHPANHVFHPANPAFYPVIPAKAGIQKAASAVGTPGGKADFGTISKIAPAKRPTSPYL